MSQLSVGRIYIKNILDKAEKELLVNFTQVQLLLQEMEALPEDYAKLRKIIEKKYSLKPFIE